MKELTKYESEDGQLYDTADEAYERDEQLEVVKFLLEADLCFDANSTPLEIVQELQKRYTITKKE